MKKEYYSKYLPVVILIVVVVLSFLIIRPFIAPLVISILLTFIFYPIYKWLNKKTGKPNLSAGLMTLVVILVIAIPLALALNSISKELYTSYTSFRDKNINKTISFNNTESNNVLDTLLIDISEISNDFKIKNLLDDGLDTLISKMTSGVSQFILAIPNRLLDLFVIFFTMFYFFRDGKKLLNMTENILPLKKQYKAKIHKKVNDVFFALVYGTIVTIIIQGIIAYIGFLIIGISSPLLWGVLISCSALLPFVGTAIIWLPLGLFYLGDGYLNNETSLIIKGIALLLYGSLVIGTIDNLIKPKIIGDRAKINPVIILIGVLGGLAAFGFVGLIIGPIILALLTTIIELYLKGEKA